MISVIICTYNRADALKKCLQSFCHVQFSEQWELIVVNNNCTDNTEDVIQQFQNSTTLPLKNCFEKNKGLGNARNAGLNCAQYELIAYTDDDCYPESDYLEQIRSSFEDEAVGFIGGRVLLHDPTDLPVTIKLSVEEERWKPGQLIKPGDIHGANFCFRKKALQDAGGFDPLFGAGAYFPCEDVDTLAECLRKGYTGLYVPNVIVHHDHGRKSQEDYAKLMHSYDVGRGAFFIKRIALKPGQRFIYFKFWFYCVRNQPVSKTWVEIKSGLRFLTRLVI